MNNYTLARLKISHVMNELAKSEPLPRLESIYRLAAKSLWTEFLELGTTEVLHDSMGVFLRLCKHPVNRSILEAGLETLTSAGVVEFYINDSAFVSKHGNALQSLCFIKEAMQHQAVFRDLCILDQIEKHLRDIDCHVPAIMNDMFCILQIPYIEHTAHDSARTNTEILFQNQ